MLVLRGWSNPAQGEDGVLRRPRYFAQTDGTTIMPAPCYIPTWSPTTKTMTRPDQLSAPQLTCEPTETNLGSMQPCTSLHVILVPVAPTNRAFLETYTSVPKRESTADSL
jgi:hypothetical protein